jgi:hypothetical protein
LQNAEKWILIGARKDAVRRKFGRQNVVSLNILPQSKYLNGSLMGGG